MNWKNIMISGAATGGILAILILAVFILPELEPESLEILCGGWFLLSVLSGFTVNRISKRAEWPEVSMRILIPIGCLTSVIPLFGPLLGMPNLEPMTLLTVVAFGIVGGLFWSIPFAMWSVYIGRKTTEEE